MTTEEEIERLREKLAHAEQRVIELDRTVRALNADRSRLMAERVDPGSTGTPMERMVQSIAADLVDETYREPTPAERAELRERIKHLARERLHRERGDL
jgi:septal ring factor EnvC (AmiA/AmiB activator)